MSGAAGRAGATTLFNGLLTDRSSPFRDPKPPTAGPGAVNPCNPSRRTAEVRDVTVRARADHRRRDRREAGLTAPGPALTIGRSRKGGADRQPPASGAPCPACAPSPAPRAPADGVERGRAERSGPARPRASSARVPARSGGSKTYRKFSPCDWRRRGTQDAVMHNDALVTNRLSKTVRCLLRQLARPRAERPTFIVQ